jgi:hypothetical protein
MIKRILIGTVAVFCTLLFVFLGLCAVASFYAEGSTSCQLASGRHIDCKATGIFLGLETHPDRAIIRTLRQTVSILPTQLQVNGRRVATIPPSTKDVEVRIDGSVVTFVADGQTVGGARR